MQVETLELQSEKNRKRLVEIVYKAKKQDTLEVICRVLTCLQHFIF